MKIRDSKTKSPGFALAVTLVIFSVLLILAASYMTSIEYDARFTKMQQAGIQAIFLASSGIEYYRDTDLCPAEVRVDNNKIIIENYPGKDKYLKITGIVCSAPDKEIARQTIIVPKSNLDAWHRE